MKRLVIIGIILSSIFLVTPPAKSIIRVTDPDPAKGKQLHWNLSAVNPEVVNGQIMYEINSAGSKDIADFNALRQALNSSFQSWQSVPTSTVKFIEGPTTTIANIKNDGILPIYWSETSTTVDDGTPGGQSIAGALAVTFNYFFPNTGEIVDSNIVFNGKEHSWSVTGDTTKVDVAAVATHEIGHLLGLDHSPNLGATMYPSTSTGQFKARTLSVEDMTLSSTIYPAASFLTGKGTVSGTVRDNNSAGVSGADVALIDANGNVFGATISQPGGGYSFNAVPPGSYTVYAQHVTSAAQLQAASFYSYGGTTFSPVFIPTSDIPLTVNAGATTQQDINVVNGTPPLTVTFISLAENSQLFNAIGTSVKQGDNNVSLGLAGPGLTGTLSFSGSGITINGRTSGTLSNGDKIIGAVVNIASNAQPGARNMIVTNGQQRIVATGALQIFGVQVSNPVPAIASISPTSVNTGPFGFALTVNGSSFVNGAIVMFGSKAETTTFISATQLTATIPASDILSAGTVQVTVVNPTPGGGTSNSSPFTVVTKTTPTINWSNPADITFGTALSATQLNATSPTQGSFAYSPTAGTKLSVGTNQTLSATFTPTDPVNFSSITVTVKINVLKATPTITWSNPADIVFGTALSPTQLNATATLQGSPVAGTFVYTPLGGTPLNAGQAQTLSTTFTPTDGADFNLASASVQINVTKALATLALSNLNPTFDGTPKSVTVTTAPQQGLTGVSVTYAGSSTPPTGAGSYAVVASLSNSNYQAANANGNLVIGKAGQSITNFATIGNKLSTDQSFNVSATATSGLGVTFSVSGNLSINGTLVTITGAGSGTVTASQVGDANHNAATPLSQTFAINNPVPVVSAISPLAAVAGSGAFNLTITGSNFFSGAQVTFNGVNITSNITVNSSTQLTVQIPAAQIVSAGTANVSVTNALSGNIASNTKSFRIVSETTNFSNASSGQTVSTSILPSQSGAAGVGATLHHNGAGTATLTTGAYSGNPTSVNNFDIGGGYVDLKVTGASATDSVTANFYYSSTVTGANETNIQLQYFNGTNWIAVKSSGNTAPVKNTTNNLDGTVSGGRITVTFDNTSTPLVTQLTGTVFTASVGLAGDLNNDGVIDASDLVLLANVLAGNVQLANPGPADVFQDGTINAADLVTLANFLAGNISTLPVVPTGADQPAGPIAGLQDTNVRPIWERWADFAQGHKEVKVQGWWQELLKS